MVADAVVMSLGQVGSTRTENETHQLEVMKKLIGGSSDFLPKERRSMSKRINYLLKRLA